MHYLNSKTGKNGFMAIKVDLAKAYDRVEWTMLQGILHNFGISEQFIKLVLACISSPRFSVLLNGSPFGYFEAKRGIRQGDPMSLTLFTIFSDLLSRILEKVDSDGKISSIKVARTSPKITHLMYTNDLIIYCKANKAKANEVYSSWQQYCN